MDRFFELQNFVGIVEAGSISGAAKRRNIAKSVASRGLKSLESRLGTSLLTRTTRHLSLTEAGEAFYGRCINILADLESAEETVMVGQNALRGRLRIAAPQLFGRMHVTPCIIAFMAHHSDLLIDVDFSDRRVDLVGEGYDLAIRLGVLEDSTLRARRLCPIRTVICASPSYLARCGRPQEPADLAAHLCIRYNRVANIHVWHYRDRKRRLGQVRVPIRALSDSSEFARDAAVAGAGLILAPDYLVQDLLSKGTLVSILDEYDWFEGAPDLFAHAVFPPLPHIPLRVRAFTDSLAQHLADGMV